MEKYIRIINKDKKSETIKSVECFPASSIKQILFDSMEDENHKRFYYIKIADTMGTTCVCVARMEAECYEVFNRFYFWFLDDESIEFVFTIDRKEINDYLEAAEEKRNTIYHNSARGIGKRSAKKEATEKNGCEYSSV